jgi:hypothetical protein
MSDLKGVTTKLNQLINRYPEHGSIEALDPLNQDYGFDVQVKPDDIVIFCDFNDDAIDAEDGRNELAEWYYDVVHQNIDKQMRILGYQAIADNDGSGGGLYYGATLFRLTK